MTLVPTLGWYNTETGNFVHQTVAPSIISPEKPSPYWSSQLGAKFPEIKVKLLHPDAIPPTRSNPSDAGLDLYAIEDVLISKNTGYIVGREDHRVLVATGIAVEIPPGTGLFLWDRSGLSVKGGLHRVAGVIDAAYRDEVRVALVNLSNQDYQIKKGDRIAQAILAPIILATVSVVDELSLEENRGGGFGHTGR